MKRRINIKKLIEKFIKVDSNFPITRSMLIMYLLENSDENLRILIVSSSSQFTPIPLYGHYWIEENKKSNSKQKNKKIP